MESTGSNTPGPSSKHLKGSHIIPNSPKLHIKLDIGSSTKTPSKQSLNGNDETLEIWSEGRSTRRYQKCPLCGKHVTAAKISEHYEEERRELLSQSIHRTDDFQSLILPSKRSRISSTSYNPLMERKDHADIRKRLDKIKKSRQRRTTTFSSAKKNRSVFDTASGDEFTCCICSQVIIGTLNDINAHVDQCLTRLPNNVGIVGGEEDGDDGDGEFETYEWAGETRVRVMSGIDGSLERMGFSSSKSEDVNDVLNVDGDDEEIYGSPQFSANDIHLDVEDDVEEEDDEPAVDIKCTGDAVIDALKARISQLEKKARDGCSICMDTYKSPLTSITCWHVYCEKCWLNSLAVKKVCPRCNVITSPHDLRKIYL